MFSGPADSDVLEGFVRCISQVFRVKDYLVVLIKITDSCDCFCSVKADHILVRWNDREILAYRKARVNFLNGCSLNRWIRATGLMKHKVYSRQPRERIVWLYHPLTSLVEVISQPKHCQLCVNSSCVSCPIGMLPVFNGFVLSVHCNGRILELTDTDPVLRSSNHDPVYWCLSSCLLNIDSVSPGSQLVLHNLWYLPINFWTHKSVNYEAVLILGIYSTCQLIQCGRGRALQTPADPCYARCCTDSCLFASKSLFPINVRAILSLCLTTQSFICPPFKNSCSNDSDAQSEHFKNAILDRIASPDPLYRPQFTEEFIKFPFLYEKSHGSCFSSCLSLTVSHFLQAFSTPTIIASDTTSREIRLELPACQNHSIHIKRTIWKPPELIDPSPWFWCLEDTVSKLEITNSADSALWFLKSLRICPETAVSVEHFEPVAVPLLIGRLCWNADEACYYLAAVPESSIRPLFPMAYSLSAYSTQTVSIPLVLKRRSVSISRKPLPRDQTIVALIGAMLIYDSQKPHENGEQLLGCNSLKNTPSLCITADQLIAMEPDSRLTQFETLSVQDTVKQNTIRLTRLGTASQIALPDTRQTRRWCYPASGVPTIDTNDTTQRFLFTGSLARRWYLAFEQDATYCLFWRSFEIKTRQHLISVQRIHSQDPSKCSHLLDPQDALALGQSTQIHPLDCTVMTVHIQGLLLHKTRTIRDWCLWCSGEVIWNSSSASAAVGSFHGKITHVVQIHIPFELDWTQWFVGFPGPLTTIRAYDLHWVRLDPSSDSVQLVASTLSRIELLRSQSVGLDDPSFGKWPQMNRLNQRNCAKCYSLWALTQQEVFTPGWIYAPVSCVNNLVDCSVPVRHISMRAFIVKCLEFHCYKSDSVVALSKSIDDCSLSSLCFYLRFLISDGSGCALVQLGRPPTITEPAFTLRQGNSLSSDEGDLVRRLFGMDHVNWRRLCHALVLELSHGMCKAARLSVYLKPTSQRDSHDSCSSLQAALRSLLTSPTFLRVHTFLLVHVPAPWKSIGNLWRLRQTRIQGTRADGSPAESAVISFVVSPPQFFTLINLRTAF